MADWNWPERTRWERKRAIWLTVYRDLTRSSERTCAFFAALRARIQSPACADSRASVMKLRTLEARSSCAAFKVFPFAAAIFRSAMLRLTLVCCCAAVVSSGVNCGMICGGSGLAAAFCDGAVGTRGRCGALVAMARGEGGGGTSIWNSGEASSAWSLAAVSTPSGLGRTTAAVLQGNVFALAFRSAHPLTATAEAHKITSNRRVRARGEPAGD
jgi:hypothetical protein